MNHLTNCQNHFCLRDAFSDEEIAAAVREADTTAERRTTAQVLQRLDELVERARSLKTSSNS